MATTSTLSGSSRDTAESTVDELRRAIESEELILHYQPIVNLADGTLTGFEALVRWRHPRLGFLCAEAFVPLAEGCGLIRPLDEWVLRTASRQLAAWQEDVLVAPGFRMAVNVSAIEMDGDGLVARVRDAIEASGVDACGLVVEVTETSKIESVESAKRSADGLHGLGVELALDDFGSRYGTFSLLSSLPFDVLKIDREFVVETNSDHGQAIVSALIDLGDRLGARVIAEGIETAEQAAQLRALGSHEGQGFFWAPALSLEDAEAILTMGRWPSSDG
jgi:diguanylate cyclase